MLARRGWEKSMSDQGLFFRDVPARAGNGPHPALVLMHGLGTDENDLLPLADSLPPEFWIISLRAPWTTPFGGYAWYGFGQGLEPDEKTLNDSVRRVGAFLDELADRFPAVDQKAVYVGGFSQGGVMAATLTCARSARGMRGSLVLSGYLPEKACPQPIPSGYPVFWGHGRLDPVVPYSRGEEGSSRLIALGASVTFSGYPIAHTISPEEMADIRQWLAVR